MRRCGRGGHHNSPFGWVVGLTKWFGQPVEHAGARSGRLVLKKKRRVLLEKRRVLLRKRPVLLRTRLFVLVGRRFYLAKRPVQQAKPLVSIDKRGFQWVKPLLHL
jgi:hypothetical protein